MERRSNPMKKEIATPFRLAMTKWDVKKFSAFVLVQNILIKNCAGNQNKNSGTGRALENTSSTEGGSKSQFRNCHCEGTEAILLFR